MLQGSVMGPLLFSKIKKNYQFNLLIMNKHVLIMNNCKLENVLISYIPRSEFKD